MSLGTFIESGEKKLSPILTVFLTTFELTACDAGTTTSAPSATTAAAMFRLKSCPFVIRTGTGP